MCQGGFSSLFIATLAYPLQEAVRLRRWAASYKGPGVESVLKGRTLIGSQKPEGILVIEYMHRTPEWPQALLPYEGECRSFLQRHANVWSIGQARECSLCCL